LFTLHIERIESIGCITLAGANALLIAFLTVSWQSYKAASKNPVEALRYE